MTTHPTIGTVAMGDTEAEALKLVIKHDATYQRIAGMAEVSNADMDEIEASYDAMVLACRAALSTRPAQEPVACQYAQDASMPEHRCAVRCVYEQKGFLAGIEQAAQVADCYDDTDTLTAPKAIAAAIRALGVQS